MNIHAAKQAETALRKSEKRLRHFGDAAQGILWMRDPEKLQRTYLTLAFETIFDLRREEALSGDNHRDWLEMIVPEDRSLANENMRRVRAGEYVAAGMLKRSVVLIAGDRPG